MLNTYIMNPRDLLMIAAISFASVWVINRVLGKYDPAMKA